MSPGKCIIQNEVKTLDGKHVLHCFYMVKRVFDQVARLIPERVTLTKLLSLDQTLRDSVS